LAKLSRLAAGQSASILAGAGLNLSNLKGFLLKSGVRRVHFGSAVRENGNPLKPVDLERVQAVRTLLNSSAR
jgi:copper homeostasis protein